MRPTDMRSLQLALALTAAFGVTPALAQDSALAQEEPPQPHLGIELNAAQSQDSGCKLSFVVVNSHDAEIAKTVFETVIFNADGQVDRLTLFDFGTLPAHRPRVRQFVLTDAPCDDIDQILFNGANTCESTSLDASACTDGIILNSRTDIEVTG